MQTDHLLSPWLLSMATLTLALVASEAATTMADFSHYNSNSNHNPLRHYYPPTSDTHRSLLVPEMDLFGVQSGPGDASTDAGGMVYDSEHDHVVLVGTTYDQLFFQSASQLPGNNNNNNNNNNNGGIHRPDCFVATVDLPPLVEESASMQHVPTTWEFDVQYRTGDNTDMPLRCDLVTRLDQWSHESGEDQLIMGGTLALMGVAGNTDTHIDATEAMLLRSKIKSKPNNPADTSGHRVEFDLMARPFGSTSTVGAAASGMMGAGKIIIPAAITSHGDSVYIATLHRSPSNKNNNTTNTAAPTKYRIDMGVSKYTGTMRTDVVVMEKVFEQEYLTDLYEVKRHAMSPLPPPVTSAMFEDKPGLEHYKEDAKEWEQEAEQEAVEEALDQAQGYLHDYRFDGVLLTSLKLVQQEGVTADEGILLIAGSAPGTMHIGGAGGGHGHPFFETQSALVGDWDGFVAKLNATTGQVMKPPANNNPAQNQAGHSTWSYRVQSQPRHHDFVQGLCLPVHAHGNNPDSKPPTAPNVAYVVGTTMGKLEGDSQGGAFLIKLDLDTMNQVWVRQIPGPQVHGLACHAVLTETGPTVANPLNDVPLWDEFVYVAGEVYGGQGVSVRKMPQETVVHTTASHGGMDIFVAQVEASDGAIKWVQQIGTAAQDRLAKNNNNQGVDDMEQLGKTGGGGGALLVDKYGNAIVYGTTTGNLGRTKSGEGFRDLFVARLHKSDGKWARSSLSGLATTSTTVHTKAPTPASAGAPRPTPAQTSSSSSKHNTYDPNKPLAPIRYEIIVVFLVVPLVLWTIIMIATSGKSDANTPVASPGGPTEQSLASSTLRASQPGQSSLFDPMPQSRQFSERTNVV